jgi:gliding motility-associated-like protein
MMRFSISNIILILLFLIPLAGSSQLSPVFIPNWGQWHENVLHKMEVQNGDVYIERDGIKFAFYDEEFFHHFHASENPDSVLKVHAFKVKFVGCSTNSLITTEQTGSAVYNYYLGKDQGKWASGLHASRQLIYNEIYPRINLKINATIEGLKYEFEVLPGGNVADIQIQISGAEQVQLVRGNLNILTTTKTLIDKAPYSYVGHAENEISSSYLLKDSIVSFNVGNYNVDDTLIIDPELVFSTFSGSRADNFGYTATYDEKGFLYSGSSIFAIGYPTTLGAYSIIYSSNPTGGNVVTYDPVSKNWYIAGYTNSDVGISKYDTTGTMLIYSTYLGGELSEVPHSIIVNSKDELFVLGTTGSSTFPTTNGAYDQTFAGGPAVNLAFGIGAYYVNGSDIFLSKLSADGTQLLGSTYFGGSSVDGLNVRLNYNYADQMRGDIAIDSSDNLYISTCTFSTDIANVSGFQTLNNGGSDGLVAKFNADLTNLIWASYIGGTENDACYSIVLDENDDLVVAGGTISTDLNTTPGSISPNYNGGVADGFVAKISNDGSSINAMTYIGTQSYDQTYFVRIDDEQDIYVYGQSASMDSSLIVNAGYYSVKSGMFISKLSNDLSNIIWSTTFGSGNSLINLSPTAFAVDICNNIYLSGWGSSSPGFESIPNYILDPTGDTGHHGGRGTVGMEVTNDAFQKTTNGNDFYLLVLDDNANTLQYATFFGGNLSDEHVDGGTSRFDRKGNIYQSVCAGCHGNSDFPIKPIPGAWSATNNSSSGCNNGVFKFDFQIPAIIADFIVPDVGCLGTNYQFVNTSNTLDATTYFWSFGDDSISTLRNPSHQYLKSGSYLVKLIIRDPVSCNLVDSISKLIILRDDSLILSKLDTSCVGDSLQIDLALNFSNSTLYKWSPGDHFSDSTMYLPKVHLDSSLNFTLIVTSEPGCADTILYSVFVPDYELILSDTIACVGDTVLNYVKSNPKFATYQWSSNKGFTDQLNASSADTSFIYPVFVSDTVFYIKVLDVSGCEFVDSLEIHSVSFDLQLSSDTVVCDVDRVWGKVINYNSGRLDSIAWSPNGKIFQGVDSISALLGLDFGANEFLVYARDTFGCVDVDTLNHVLRSDSLSYAKIDTSCAGDSLQIDLSLSFLPSSTYLWAPGSLFSDSTIYLPKVLTDSTVNLALVVREIPGCTDTILYPVFVPIHELVLSNSIVCFGDTVLNYVLSDPSFVTYQWSTNPSFSDQLNVLSTDTAFNYVVVEGDTTFYLKVIDLSGCEFVDSLAIRGVNFQIEADLDTIVCNFAPVWERILNHQMSGLDSIAWSPQAQVVQGSDSTSALLNLYGYLSEYQVYARDTNGCADIDTIKIVDSSLDLDLSDTTICFGDTIQLGFELSNNPLYRYEWIPNVIFDKDSLKTKAALNDSVKLQLIVDNSFCIDTVSQFVSVNKVDITSGIDTLLCNNLQTVLLEVIGEDTLTYYWYNDSTALDTVQYGVGLKSYDFVPPNGETILYIQAQDNFGCKDSAEIKLRSSFFELTYPTDSTLCLNDTVVLAPKEDLSEMGSVKFAWSPAEVILSDTTLSSVQVYDSDNGQWTIKVFAENKYGCKDSDLIILSFSSLDTSKIIAIAEPKTILNTESALIEVTPENYKYSILPDEGETTQDGNNFTVFPKESRTYLLTVIDSLYGKCRKITSVDIEVLKFICDDPYIYVPNAFTPNGDGENDFLFVRGKNITKLYFAIFNRWGQKVFETEEQHIGWDGTFKGMQIDPAVYDYYLKYECDGEEEHFKKGNITLIK